MHDTNTPHRSETNGIPERFFSTSIKEQRQGGFKVACSNEWWDCAMQCYCYLRNVHDKMAHCKTAYEKAFRVQSDGKSFSCHQRDQTYKFAIQQLSTQVLKSTTESKPAVNQMLRYLERHAQHLSSPQTTHFDSTSND